MNIQETQVKYKVQYNNGNKFSIFSSFEDAKDYFYEKKSDRKRGVKLIEITTEVRLKEIKVEEQ